MKLSKHNKYVHLVEKSIYVLLWLAEKSLLHAFTAGGKTSHKFSRASHILEKYSLGLYLRGENIATIELSRWCHCRFVLRSII